MVLKVFKFTSEIISEDFLFLGATYLLTFLEVLCKIHTNY